MDLITIDFETYYDRDYSLSKITTEEYIRDPRFEVIGVGVKVNNEPTEWASGTHEQIKTYLHTFDWAKLLMLAIEKDLKGIYNFVSRDAMSKYDFGVAIAKLCKLDTDLISPISVDDFGFKAKRAKRISLCTDKLEKDLGDSVPGIKETLGSFCKDASSTVAEAISGFYSAGMKDQ